MARPSRGEERELEQLETLAALSSSIIDAAGVLSVRLRQVQRRALGDEALLKVLKPAGTQLAEIADQADDMHQVLRNLLDQRQRERQEKNGLPRLEGQ